MLLKLTWKKFGILVASWFLAVLLHNAIYGLFGVEEALFFIIAVFVIPAYLIISVIYTLIKKFKK